MQKPAFPTNGSCTIKAARRATSRASIVATPGSTDVVAVGQAYAWNPSITGAKSEDTILVGEKDNEVLTTISGWPVLSAAVDGQTMARPAILQIL